MCDIPGCTEAGAFRAPKSRSQLNDYHWFCLDHVRAYNAGWDFYKGMSPAEVEAQLRADTAWQRPTWPLGRLGHTAWDDDALRDPLHILAVGRCQRQEAHGSEQSPGRTAGTAGHFGTCRGRRRWMRLSPATRNWPNAITPMPTAAAATRRSG